jgi:VWFA-related protein
MIQKFSLVLVLTTAICVEPVSVRAQNSSAPASPAIPSIQTSQDDEVVRITTNLIQVDAVVTDKNGKPVTDLRADEFEIQENGEQKEITNFSYVPLTNAVVETDANPTPANSNAPPAPPVKLRPDQVRRTIALVVDDVGLSFESMHFVRRALKKFVDEQMQPGDLVAIVRTGGGAGALQQFTSDKRQLHAAIERVRWNQLGRGGVTAFAPIEGRGIADQMRSESPGNSDGGAGLSEDLNEFRNELFTIGTLGALSYIVQGLRDLPGRKSVMLMSDGIKIFTNIGQNLPSSGIRPGVGGITGSDRILGTLRRLIDQANRSSVVIYTMDARGLQTLGLTSEDDVSGLSQDQVERNLFNRRADFFESQNGLNYLAQQTGGLAIRNSNDLSRGIKRMLDDQSGYYLIGYRPDEETFDPKRARYNKLTIKVKRPGLKVRYRSGFFGIKDEETRPAAPQTRASQLVRAIVAPFASGGINVRLTSLFANDATSGSFMTSLLHVDATKLTFTEEPDGWHKVVFDVMAVTFGEGGALVDELSRTETVRLRGDTLRLVMQEGFDYIITVPIKKPGAYQLRTALRDSVTERIGSASQFIEVPDLKKDRLALSGIIINGIDPQKLKKSAAAGDSAGDKVTPEPQTGPGVRLMRRGLILEYGYVIYNAKLDKSSSRPQLQTQVRLFRDGKELFAGNVLPFDPGNQTDMKRLGAGGRIQLSSDMVPGDYILQIIVTDSLAKEKQRTSTQWIDFVISDK